MTVLHVGPFTPRHRSTDWRVVVWDAVSMAELAFASWAAACYVDTGSVLAAVATGVLVADGGVRLRRTSKFADTVPVPVSAAPGGGVLSARRPATRGPLASGRGTAADDAPTGAVPVVFPAPPAGANPRVDAGRSVTFPPGGDGPVAHWTSSARPGRGHPHPPRSGLALGGQADRGDVPSVVPLPESKRCSRGSGALAAQPHADKNPGALRWSAAPGSR